MTSNSECDNADVVRPGPGWLAAQHILCLSILVVGPVLRGDSDAAVWWWCRVSGALLLVLGGVVGVAGVRDLGTNRTPSIEPLPANRLVTSGIYARVRHPLYVSLIILSVAWALIWCSVECGVLALVLGMVLHGKAVREEACMRWRHADYETYQQRVPRYIPKIHHGRRI